MKLKRILALVLAFCMVFTSMSFSAFAEGEAYVAEVNSASYETLQLALDAAKEETNIEIKLVADATLDINAWDTLAIGGDATESITINGNNHTLTFNHLNSDWNNVVTKNGAKLILNNMKITNSGYNDGPWNRHDINFACDVELNNVSSDKALAFKAGAVLDTVTITDANTSDTYAIWIQPNGQTVTITNSTIDMLACSDGRGIKIDNQYRAEGQEDKVTLNVSGTSFKTEEKAAIMVKSEVGADINLSEVDISGVAADTVNAVWNDEDTADYLDKITVTGGTVKQEGAASVAYVAQIEGGASFASLADAVVAAKSGDIITILQSGDYEMPKFKDKELTFIGVDKENTTINDWVEKNSQGMSGSTVHFKDLTINGQTTNYYGLFHTNGVTYDNCNINGLRFLYSPTTFTDCAFDANGVEHSFWTYGASEVTVNKCTFEYTDRAVNCYSEAGADHETDITFKECTFIYTGTADAPEGAIEINSGSSKSIDLALKNCTAPAKGKMWFNSRWDSKNGANTTVTVDDTQVWPVVVNVAKIGDKKYTSLQAAIDAAQTDDVITIISDIVMTTENYVTNSDGYAAMLNVAGKSVTIDLNGKTIKVEAVADDLTNAKDTMLMAVFAVDTNGTLTLEDNIGTGTVDVTANDATVYSLAAAYGEGSKLNIESGSYTADKVSSALIYSQYDKAVTVSGGNFRLDNVGTGSNGSPWIVNVSGKGDGYVSITGGTFNANIQRQYWTTEVKVPVSHYMSKNADDTWTVKEGSAVSVKEGTLFGPYYASDFEVGYPSLQAFLDAANANVPITIDSYDPITLLKDCSENINIDIVLNEPEENNERTLTLNLNGYQYSGTITLCHKDNVLISGEGLNVVSGVAGYKVQYADGMYTLIEEPKPYIAQVGGVKHKSLAGAIEAANAVTDGATVELIKDITLGEKLVITGNVTISGEHTITRAEDYTGTLFEVSADATLTLDGGLVVDGGNAWKYTKFPLEMDMANGDGTYVGNHITPAEGGVNATASLIKNNGTLNANKVTIENSYSTNGVSAIDCGTNSATILNGAVMQKIAANRSGAVVYVGGIDAVLTITGETKITGNFGIGNGGIIQNYGQGTTVNMTGGSIDNNHIGKSGTLYASYSSNANKINTFNMSGGIITKNIMEGYGPVYIHTNTVWNMTGGEISENTSFLPNYVRNNNPAGIMSGGKIVNNKITGTDYSNGYYVTRPDLRLNGKTGITGGEFTQDVTEYLAPDNGLVYNEETGTYGLTQYLYEYNGVAYKTLAEVIEKIKTTPATLADEDTNPVVKVLATHRPSKTIVIDTNIVLDLNGKSLLGVTGVNPIIRVSADVTITGNGMIDSANQGNGYCFIVGSSDGSVAGNLTIENGTFKGTTTAVSVTKGTATILDGDFRVKPYQVDGQDDNYNFLLNCIDANYQDGSAKIIVKGGKFTNFNPANNAAEGTNTSFVAPGHMAVDNGDGTYGVVKENIAKIGSKYYTTLSEAISKATDGDIIELLKTVVIDEDMTLDLNGYTVMGNIVVEAGATVEIKNGKIINNNENVSAIQSYGTTTLTDLDVTSARHAVRVEGGITTINSGDYKVAPISKKTLHAVNVSGGGQVVINGGNFTGPKGTVADSGAAVNIQTGSTGTINGGVFKGGKNNTLSAKGTLAVYGGVFDQDPTSYVADGYVATPNADNTLYMVTAERTLRLVPSATEVKTGNTFTVDVYIDTANVWEVEWVLEYDETLFEIVDMTTSYTNWGDDKEPAIYATNSAIDETKPVATYTFKKNVKASTQSEFTFKFAEISILTDYESVNNITVPCNDAEFSIKINLDYVVEVDTSKYDYYITGKKLVLVYTNATGITFDYDGIQMYEVTGAGYEYEGEDKSFTQTADTKVYALVVDAINNGVFEDYEVKVSPDHVETATVITYDKKYIFENKLFDNDVSGDSDVEPNDITNVYLVAVCNEIALGEMDIMLKADVDGDKQVNMFDAKSIINELYRK